MSRLRLVRPSIGSLVILSLAAVLVWLAWPDRARSRESEPPAGLAQDADWRSGAVCYEIFVRSFYDSDGDGVGDLRGLTEKLDYVNDGDPDSREDLGARCIWLMPVAQSPSYHGYDVTDYYHVNRDYGTEEDFRRLVSEAHARGIRVLVDLVLNHASSEHPYFKDALLRTDSPWRDWFIWSPVSLQDRSSWDTPVWHRSPTRDEYYYGLFWSGMPDLNFENPEVMAEAERIARYWLEDMGVDGFRLDAVRHLVEEDGELENTPGTHEALREIGGFIREIAPGSYTIGEVWDSIGATLPYYPDQLDAYFAFEASDAILAAVDGGSAGGLLAPFLRLQDALPAERWSPFLRNHDQTRTMTALGGDAAKAKLAATLLLTLPGLPFVYYGEELGMTGDKPDPRIRTPLPWSRRPGVGFTDGVAWEPLHADSLTANVEAQTDDPTSLLNLYRNLIHLRAANAALGEGELVAVAASAPSVAAYLRVASGGEAVLVVANLAGAPISGVTLSAEPGALPGGTWSGRDILGGADAAPVETGPDGSISGWVPFPELGPRESRVVELARAGG